MLQAKSFCDTLVALGINLFTGVPDSLLKQFCAYLEKGASNQSFKHIIAANEGAAVGLAIGHHLATSSVPLVYMQNSGLGNVVNPLTSLADSEVYQIPLLLMIGWRGEPTVKDEPQHIKQGRITPALLDTLEIPYEVLDPDETMANEQVSHLIGLARSQKKPCALLVRKNSFEVLSSKKKKESTKKVEALFTREEAIHTIVKNIDQDTRIVSTTGMASRELYEYRDSCQQGHALDFLTVGGMGHASQIALGLAQVKSARPILCLDGDGASLMHMGSLAIIGQSAAKNLLHVVLNNGAHDSVGGQATVARAIDLPAIAKACGYAWVNRCDSQSSLVACLPDFLSATGPAFLEVLIDKGNRKDLGRPKESPAENKVAFMDGLL